MKVIYTLIFCAMVYFGQGQNYALHFDGENDEVRLNHEAGFNVGEEFTIEAWINATEWRAEQWQGTIVGKDKSGPDEGFAFRCGKSGTLSFVMSTNNSWKEVATGPIMEKGVWNHVAVVVANGSMSLFVNGEQKTSAGYSGTFSGNQLLRLKLGASGEFPDRIFYGAIDEVRIWSIAKTAQELFDNSLAQLSGDEVGLVAYLPLDEGTGFTTANLANTGNPGILTNMMEDDWVNGASLTGVDVGVTDILNPNLLHAFERPVEVEVEIKNFGNDDLSGFDIDLLVNGDLITTETVIEAVESGEKYIHTFQTFIDLTGLDNASIEVSTSHEDDSNSLNDSQSMDLSAPSASRVTLFNRQTHNFGADGQTHLTNVIFPSDMQHYSQILMHIDLDCPSGGCDPWDQPAHITLTKDGVEYEIARYITPYGKACGVWTVDITDFKSVLGGPTQFKSYIQVWGTSGWDLTAEIELIQSSTEATFQKLSPLWQSDYWIYGDPNIEDDLEQRTIIVDADTESSHMRMTISGHGQGNTDNAAEFSPKTHTITVDDDPVATHFLWKSDCAANPCNAQAGTWTLSRAGWCPGQAVEPYVLNLTDQLPAGFLVRIDYELEEYTNLLNTGYNGGSHTEPHYRLHGFLIEQSSQRYENFRNLSATELDLGFDGSNPATGPVALTFVNDGTVLVTNPIARYYVNGNLILEEAVSGTIQPGETYTHTFSETFDFDGSAYDVVAHVDYDFDQNIGDDLIKVHLPSIVASDDVFIKEGIEIYPNPSSGIFNIEISENIHPSQLELYHITGELIAKRSVSKRQETLNIKVPGVYLVKILDLDHRIFSKRLIVSQ